MDNPVSSQLLREWVERNPFRGHWLCEPLAAVGLPQMQAAGDELRSKRGSPVGDYSTLVSQRAFSEYFYLRWLDTLVSGALPRVSSSRDLASAIQCEGTLSDFQHFLLSCYATTFRRAYASEMHAFLTKSRRSEMLVVHVSCQSSLSHAKRSAATFKDAHERIANLIVIGIPGTRYSFDVVNDMLVVPAGDHYEDLPAKVGAALHFIGMSGYGAPVIKVDDDICCVDPEEFVDAILAVADKADYSGRVTDPTVPPGISRTWHIGKCTSPAANWKPFSRIPHAAYAEGPIYVLSSNALHALSKAWLMFLDHFVEAGCEDLAIGEALSHFNIYPCPYDLRQLGLVFEAKGQLGRTSQLSVAL